MPYRPPDIEPVRDRLASYLEGRDDISFSYLFGSRVKGTATAESDWDVAVYFRPDGRELEWEEEKRYGDEDEIWGEIERLVGDTADFVVLNRAPSTLALAVLLEGIPLLVRSRSLLWRFFLRISMDAEDERAFARDYVAVKDRSRSLSEIDRDRLVRIIDFIETELADLESFRDLEKRGYFGDSAARRNVERWVENLINASIDIAKILLASHRLPIPQTYREALRHLSLLDGFPDGTARELSSFAKLRNILAHEYLDVRFESIRRFIDGAEGPIRFLVARARSSVESKG